MDALFWTATEPKDRRREHIGIIPHFVMAVVYVCILQMRNETYDVFKQLKSRRQIIKSAWDITVSISLSLLIDCILTMLMHFL